MALTIESESYYILKRAGSRPRRHRTNHQKARRYVQKKLRYERKDREREKDVKREREKKVKTLKKTNKATLI